jgi:diadenosine tetraphosphate (Ap4A) HIT family hydrolase
MDEPVDLGPTGGVVWARPEEWARRSSPSGCIVCISGGPLDIVATLPTCWATVPRRAPLAGYVCVVARQHVIEPFEMPAADQAAFWQDTMVIAQAVASLTQPIKMNYEIHGNTLPHLHVHLFPRKPSDAFVGGPVDPRKVEVERTDAEIAALRHVIQSSAEPG